MVARALVPWVERAYWSFMLRTSSIPVRGLRFIYISALEGRPAADIHAALDDALARIGTAGAGFGELVTSHLRFMAALDAPKAVALVHARGYSSPCPRVEVDNPQFLACRLIRAATHIRLSRDALAHGGLADPERIRKAAYEAQLRFVQQFPDPQEWIDYIAQADAI
jgi:hypothetical protein